MATTYADALAWMLRLGYTQADLDDFIRRNGAQDIRRIESAFSTYNDRGLATGTVASRTAAVLGVADYNMIDHTGMIATPTPLANEVGSITQVSDADGRVIGTGSGNGFPALAYSRDDQLAGVATVLPASAANVPPWIWIVAAVAILVFLSERK